MHSQLRTFTLAVALLLAAPLTRANEAVVLLHGLMRQPSSMSKMADALADEGYTVHNLGYPSREFPIEDLAKQVRQEISTLVASKQTVHFVTHSMGGILVRQIQKTDPLPNIGRVVMLSPPNKGSEVVDTIGDWKLFNEANGPAGNQLGTAANGFIAKLGPVNFECGIITGDRSINWINSYIIPGQDDGKVSVESAKVAGMQAYKVVHATHPMIMKKKSVIEEVVQFMKNGSFKD